MALAATGHWGQARAVMTFIWFIVWMVNGHPWLLGDWTPWNIALIACAFFDNIAAGHARGRSRPSRA